MEAFLGRDFVLISLPLHKRSLLFDGDEVLCGVGAGAIVLEELQRFHVVFGVQLPNRVEHVSRCVRAGQLEDLLPELGGLIKQGRFWLVLGSFGRCEGRGVVPLWSTIDGIDLGVLIVKFPGCPSMLEVIPSLFSELGVPSLLLLPPQFYWIAVDRRRERVGHNAGP